MEEGLIVNNSIKESLISSTKWAKFLLILGAISVALLTILSLFLFAGASYIDSYAQTPISGILGVIYLVAAAIMIYPLIKGFNFCNATRKACETNNEAELYRGFDNMHSFLKFYGIIAIILLVIYALAIIGIVAAAAIS